MTDVTKAVLGYYEFKRFFSADTDEQYFLKQRLHEIADKQENLIYLQGMWMESEDPWWDSLIDSFIELQASYSTVRIALLRENRLVRRIKNICLTYFAKSPSLNAAFKSIKEHVVCRRRSRYLQNIFRNIYKYLPRERHRREVIHVDYLQNYYSVLLDEVTTPAAIEMDEEVVIPLIVKKKPTRTTYNIREHIVLTEYGPRVNPETVRPQRNIFLLDRLRVIKKYFMQSRLGIFLSSQLGWWHYDVISGSYMERELVAIYQHAEEKCVITEEQAKSLIGPIDPGIDALDLIARPEMDMEGVHGDTSTVPSVASNVILLSDTIPSVEVTTEVQPSWSSYCSADVNPSYASVTDRWLQIETFPWKKDQPQNTFLANYLLPHDIVTKEQLGNACAMPNLMAFNVHRYWRGDMEVKVQVNCNRFQIGSLQVAWLYSPDFDEQSLNRTNIFSLSQTNHCLITANTSNEAIIRIPYKYYLPLLHTKPRSDMPVPLAMGRLYISVINPLTVPAGGPEKANVTVFVRFIDSEFTGMLAGTIDPLLNTYAEPEMDRVLSGVMGGLNALCSDPNRDNPPVVAAPRYLVPTASHSWSVGTNLSEPLHTLRLDARGQTPHPPGASTPNEMTVDSITQIFGLIKTIEWSKSDAAGSIIASFDASPLLQRNNYYTLLPKVNNQLTGYCLPPVAVASGMYMGWRGSLEFRFDVIASQYHTGRLMIAYVPGASKSTNMTLAQLRASTNVVYTLNDSDQFSFTVPYVANKPVWPRKYGGDYRPTDNLSPSRVYLVIINELIPMQNVSDHVFLNMYMRGGADFELLVPVQPSLGLLNNRNYIVNVNKPSQITAIEGYFPYYSGTFEDLTAAQTFRWGTLSHEIAHFSAANWYDASTGQYTYCIPKLDSDTPKFVDSTGKLVPVPAAVFFYLQETGYVVGIPCVSVDAAKQLSLNVYVLGLNLNSPTNSTLVVSNTWSTTSNTYCKKNMVWVVAYEKKPSAIDCMFDEDFVHVTHLNAIGEGERDNVVDLQGLGQVNTTQKGLKLYGENFSSLKDLTRRYQLYGVYLLKTVNKDDSDKIKFSFPCLPQGLNLDIGNAKNINEIYNRGRDGHIPLIASGYRFYRGGLRFRMIFDSDPDLCVYIQHRPDRILQELRIVDHTKILSGETVANHTYASYMQLTSINGIVEFEVPYYMFGLYGLLQHPKITKTDESNFFSLGEISVGVVLNNLSKTPKQLLLTIYYSAADDLSFSTFQGFPPVCFTADVPQSTVPPAQPEGLFDWFTAPLTEATNVVVSNVKEEIAVSSRGLATAIREKIQDLDMNYRDSIIKMALSLSHTFIDQTPKTLVISIISVLLEMKILIFDNITSLITALSEAVIAWVQRVSSERITEEGIIPAAQPEMFLDAFSDKEWVKVLGLLFVGVCTAIGVTCAPPTNMRNFSRILTTHLPSAVKGGSFIMSFLNGVLDIVKAFLFWIMSKVYPVESFYFSMEQDIPDVKVWVNEVNFLIKQNLTNVIDFDGIWLDRVSSAVDFGHALIERCIEADDKQIHILYKIQDKIQALYDKLEAMGKHPFVRKEPFCLWVAGAPGIGKSFLMEFLSSHLLQSANIRTKGAKVFTVMPATEFWSGCKDQPVLNLDDAFSVELGETLERQLNIMYMVKSPVALNPPMANLEDKFLRYNPDIFYINSNKKFLNISGLDPSAIHRRRDVLIEARMLPGVLKDSSFGHLRFDVLNPNVPNARPIRSDLTYQSLVEYLIPIYQTYRIAENQNYMNRVSTYDGITLFDTTDLRSTTTLKQQMVEKRREKELQYRRDVHASVTNRVCQQYDVVKNYIVDSIARYTVPVMPVNDYVQQLGALWPQGEISNPEINTLGVIYSAEINPVDAEIDQLGNGIQFKQSIYESMAGSMEAEDASMVDSISIITTEEENEVILNWKKEAVLKYPLIRTGSCDNLTDFGAEAMHETVEDLSVFQDLSYVPQGTFEAFCETLRKTSIFRYHTVEMFKKHVPNFVKMYKFLYDTPADQLPTIIPPFIVDKFVTPELQSVIPTISLNYFSIQVRFLIKYFVFPIHYTQFRKRRRLEVGIVTDHPLLDRVERGEEQVDAVTNQMQQLDTDAHYSGLMENYPAGEVLRRIVRDLTKFYTLNKSDYEFFKIGTLRDTNFNGLNIRPRHFTPYVPPSSYDKYYYFKKPWLIWEEMRSHIDTCFGCIHTNDTCEWDFNMSMWVCHDNPSLYPSTAPNVATCGDNCVLKHPIFAKFCNVYHVYRSSLGRTMHSKGKIDKLPLYFKTSIDDLTVLATSWFDSFKDKFMSVVKNSIAPCIIHILKLFGVMAVAFAGMGFVGWVYKWMSGCIFGPSTLAPPVPEVVSAVPVQLFMPSVIGEKAYTIETKPKHYVAKIMGKGSRAEGFSQNYNDIIRKVHNNAFVIVAESITDGTVRINKARGLGIRNHQGIFIKHYYQYFLSLPRDTTKFYLERLQQGNLGNRLEIDFYKFVVHDFEISDENFDTNFCLLEFPSFIPFFKDITNNFATIDEHKNAGSQGDLISFGSGNSLGLNMYLKHGLQIAGEGAVEPVLCYSVYAYRHHGPGVCGSVLMARNLPNRPIIGIHVAGLSGEGYSEPIFKEMFTNSKITPSVTYEENELGNCEDAKITLRTTLLPDGIVKPEMAHVETGKTQYVPSKIHGVFPVDTAPNPLSSRDPRISPNSPMRLGCEKHGMPVRPFPTEVVDVVSDNFFWVILGSVKPPVHGAHPWTLQDAVCGNPAIPHCEPLDWGTSPGYGYNEVRQGKRGKKFLFDLEETKEGYKCVGLHKKLQEIMLYKNSLRNNNIVPVTVFVDCLKDTCIANDKCKIPGKTRIFSISPVDFTVQFRQYFGAFMSGYTAARFDAEHAIGINVDGPEWSQLAQKMQKHGHLIVDGDYSNFGPSLSLQLVSSAFDIILRWYAHHGASDKSQQYRRIMIREFINAPHLCFNLLYRTYAGIPSGSPITSILNSMVNSLLIRIAWCNLVKPEDCLAPMGATAVFASSLQYWSCTERGQDKNLIIPGSITVEASTFHLPSICHFVEQVEIVTYGDDVFLNVTSESYAKFNVLSISKFFDCYNIRFTDSSKSNNVVLSVRTLKDITFLSRGFTPHPTRRFQYLSPLKEISIHSCANWVTKKNDLTSATLQNAEMVQWLAYGHGRKYYDDINTKLLTAFTNINVKWIPRSYDEMDRIIWESDVTMLTTNFKQIDFL